MSDVVVARCKRISRDFLQPNAAHKQPGFFLQLCRDLNLWLL